MLEGHRALVDAMDAGVTPSLVLVDDSTPSDRLTYLPSSVSVRRVASRLFTEIASTQHPQGVLAVVPFPDVRPTHSTDPLTLVVDAVRDPGNLGTLLRSAAAAGVDRVALLPTTVDPYNAKVVRAGMGAHFRVGIEAINDDELARVAADRGIVALLDAHGDQRYDDTDWTQPALIIIGGEAFGPRAASRAAVTVSVRIPLAGGIESLNAGVAGSIVLFEAARQRRASGRFG